MNCYSRLPQALLRLSVLCAALGAAYSTSAQPLPPFTLSPPGSTPPLAGTAVRADNIIISDFSTVRLTGPSFSDSGFLSVQSFQLGGTTVTAPGLNSTYGLFFEFARDGNSHGRQSGRDAHLRPVQQPELHALRLQRPGGDLRVRREATTR